MQPVNVGIIGLGNVGMGALAILAETQEQIATKLGFPLHVKAVCSPRVDQKTLPAGMESAIKTAHWREVVDHPEIHIVAELVGGTGVAREIIEASVSRGKSVVTA